MLKEIKEQAITHARLNVKGFLKDMILYNHKMLF